MPLDRIVGTVRHPSQNSADFRPLPYLRGRNWHGRWQRIEQGIRELAVLPAIDLVKVGDEYYVADGHNRVAAAIQVGAVAIDADVTEVILPGTGASGADRFQHREAHALVHGADELRQAAAGRQSRTAEHRPILDELRREQLARGSDRAEPEAGRDAEPEAGRDAEPEAGREE